MFSGPGFDVSNIRHSSFNIQTRILKKNQWQLASDASCILVSALLNEKGKASEVQWMSKVSEEDYLLQSCDDTRKLCKTMFLDSSVPEKFSMSGKKVPCIANAKSKQKIKFSVWDFLSNCDQ